MLRVALFILTISFTLPGLAQDQARNWVFGQGLGMHFHQDSVSFFNASWTPTEPNYQHDGNQSATLSDRQGNLRLYFINGEYYDGNHQRVHKRETHYFNNGGLGGALQGNIKTSVFIPQSRDTALHIYLLANRDTTSFFRRINTEINHTIILNRVTYNQNSQQWKIKQMDRYSIGEDAIMDPHFKIFTLAGKRYLEFRKVTFRSQQGQGKIFEISVNKLKNITNNNSADLLKLISAKGYFNPFNELFYVISSPSNGNRSRLVWLFSFNAALHNFVKIGEYPLVSPNDINTQDYRTWEAQKFGFSYEKRYLYAVLRFSGTNPQRGGIPGEIKLVRYDLWAKDSTAFKRSAQEINLPLRNRTDKTVFTDIQAAPDGNLYFTYAFSPSGPRTDISRNLSFNKHIGQITNPDDSVTANIRVTIPFKSFGDWEAFRNLPEFIAEFSIPDPFREDTLCLGEALTFNYPNAADSVKWDFGVPALGGANISFQKNPVLPYTQPGKYQITADLYFGGKFLRSLSDSLVVIGSPRVKLPEDTVLCAGNTLSLSASQDSLDVQYLWQDGSTDSTFTVRQPGVYHVAVYNRCDTVRDTIRVSRPGVLDLPNDTLICGESPQPLLLQAGIQWPQATYRWQDGSTDSIFAVQDSGRYWVEVQTQCGVQRDTVAVDFALPPQDITLRDTSTCEREPIMLRVNAPTGASITWNTGATEHFIIPKKSGLYSVKVSNGCATATAQAQVDILQCECPFFAPDAFSPNGDGLNDVFELKYDCDGLSFHIAIYNRWGELVYEHNENQPFWDGTSNGTPVPQGVYVYHLRYSGPTAQGTINQEERGTIRVIR